MKTVKCQKCGEPTTKSISRYNESIKNGWNFFCSIKCRYSYQEKSGNFHCAWCSEAIVKTPAEIRKTKSNAFCSKSCAARYNNRHKKTGTRRSKLECYIEQQLRSDFPDLNFLCNTKSPIGAELDFYFPDLKLAIELNGFLHFKPVYGLEKLNRVQEIDREKAEKCFQMNIELHIIDVSQEFHLTADLKEKHWKNIKELVTSPKKCAGYTNEQVSFL